MIFDWNEKKNAANILKHGLSLRTASRIFEGPVLTSIDNRFDYGEKREVSIGVVESIAVLVVVRTDRDGVRRLISARRANRMERKRYEEAIS